MATALAPRTGAGDLNGIRKAAILTVLIGEEASGALFKHLNEEEIEAIAREIALLGPVSAATATDVLEEFHQMWRAAEYVTKGGVDYASKLLSQSLGADLAKRVLDQVVKNVKSTRAFTGLERADPQQLSKFIQSEHPQTVALILAHLKPVAASQLMQSLPEELRVEVVTRMANLEEISPDVISRISAVIEQRLKSLGGTPSHESYGGIRAVAELLNHIDRSISQSVLEVIETQTPDLAVSIRHLMFVFDDLLHVDDNALREIVQRADKKVLTVALKGTSEEMRNRFFQNMSKRAVDMIREEIELLGAVRLREVEKAQQDVVGIARKLEEEGLLQTGAAAGEPYVT
ncbi:MAG: flagellar motor switch protein FliG [Acidobacteria bacterium]|nr:flagellar motor switch protein FliG [Acidobacteriota bacterium]